jgi:hypothetical protein
MNTSTQTLRTMPLVLLLAMPAVFIASNESSAQSGVDYAEHLLSEHDYFRAVSEFKKMLYFAPDESTRIACLYGIARGYLGSGNHNTSLQYSARFLDKPTLTGQQRTDGFILMGLGYYGIRAIPSAETAFARAGETDTSGRSALMAALLKAEMRDWTAASSRFKAVAEAHPGAKAGGLADSLSKAMLRGAELPSRSPFLAACMSALLPGSGQIYSGHFYDGVQAFLFVGAFSLASYAAYRYDDRVNNNYLMTIGMSAVAALFHAANIFGAFKTAEYKTARIREDFLAEMRKAVLPVVIQL